MDEWIEELINKGYKDSEIIGELTGKKTSSKSMENADEKILKDAYDSGAKVFGEFFDNLWGMTQNTEDNFLKALEI